MNFLMALNFHLVFSIVAIIIAKYMIFCISFENSLEKKISHMLINCIKLHPPMYALCMATADHYGIKNAFAFVLILKG